MPIVKFTSNLKRFYPELSEINLKATSIPEIIHHINDQYPGLKDYILDEQFALRKHVNIFINNKMVNDRQSLNEEIGDNDEVFIMQALSGG